MNPDEMYVRERWERVAVSDAIPSLEIKEAIKILAGEWKFFVDYSAARAFTEQREEEIRRIEAEIIDIELVLETVSNSRSDHSDIGDRMRANTLSDAQDRWRSILARTQSTLSELTCGMVGDGKL